MKAYRKTFATILLLIGTTTAALAYMGAKENDPATKVNHWNRIRVEPLGVDASLVQDKVLQGSDGTVSVALTLTGADIERTGDQGKQPVDLVVVLDRSGSMQGRKMDHARSAVLQLISSMGPEDRMGIITYSNHVEMLSGLVALDGNNRDQLAARIDRIFPSGGTNLGGGLQGGISMLAGARSGERQRKVILISDGLANQGITSTRALGAMAARATEFSLGVTTVGVGYDFNEVLMTTIADHGSGNYHFLEHPGTFAALLEKEFEATRNVIANNIELSIPLPAGVQLIDAGGYPVHRKGSAAVIRPGDILAGQQRTIYLTYRVPTARLQSFSLDAVQARYQHRGEAYLGSSEKSLVVACVEDRDEVIASIDKKSWSTQVVKEEYSRLKDYVADAIRNGEKEEALEAIDEYKTRTETINQSVDSVEVSNNLESDVAGLQKSVQETFAGAPAAVAEKQKQQAKKLQYDSYRARRDKQ